MKKRKDKPTAKMNQEESKACVLLSISWITLLKMICLERYTTQIFTRQVSVFAISPAIQRLPSITCHSSPWSQYNLISCRINWFSCQITKWGSVSRQYNQCCSVILHFYQRCAFKDSQCGTTRSQTVSNLGVTVPSVEWELHRIHIRKDAILIAAKNRL